MMRLLALDVGERRIGVAVSDPTGTIARPLRALERASKSDDFSAIAALVGEYDAEAVVVGQPLSLDGSVGPQARRVARYAEALAEHLSVPVIPWDERFSTAKADEILRETRREKAKRRARASGEIDAIAAAVILQSYLDSVCHGSQNPA
ncbi:MAG: Holliday junction resolvase RuvX [Anaerolineae bacterium]|jgi:putative Holliday junction resolvase